MGLCHFRIIGFNINIHVYRILAILLLMHFGIKVQQLLH